MSFYHDPAPAEAKACSSCGHVEGDPLRPGHVLRAARIEAGLTQEQLLDKADICRDQGWLSKVESDRKGVPPVIAEWVALCAALGLDPLKAAEGAR